MRKAIAAVFGIVLVIGCAAAAWKYYLTNITEMEIAARAESFSSVESFGYKNLRVGFFADRLVLDTVTLKLKGVKEPLTAEKLFIPRYRFDNNRLVSLEVILEGVDVFSGKLGELTGVDTSNHLISKLVCRYQYDPRTQTMTMEDLKIIAPELAEIHADTVLVNIDPSALFLEDPYRMLSHLIGVSISDTIIRYRDRSLLKKIILSQPDAENPAAAGDILRSVAGGIHEMIEKEKDLQTRLLLETFAEFLKNPGQLHLIISPPKPIPLGRLLWVRHLRDAVGLLNVQIKGTQV